MNRIEAGLHEHHARLAEQAANNPGATSSHALASGSGPSTLEAPFAKVNSVVPGSPADSAGLKAGDTITKFGWVDWTNHDKLARLAEAVSQNEGVSCLQHPSLACIEYSRTTVPAKHACLAVYIRASTNSVTASPNSEGATTQQLWRTLGSC